MTERKFKVIKGGAANAVNYANRRFMSAFITDTRLMGVVGLHIHWELYSSDFISDFHQYFYFDAEEYGFETYKSLMGSDADALAMIEQALIGGLGGSKVNVSEREAVFLVQKYTEMNKALSLPLPDQKNEYEFILHPAITLTEEENKALADKLCTPILTDYQLINYFLMRTFGRDFEAAAYLTAVEHNYDSIAEKNGATLCKNTIEEYFDEEGSSYLCESLIEWSGKYKLIISELTVENLKIASIRVRSSFFVTSTEAAMMLNHPEFITVYEILSEPDDFTAKFSNITTNCMQTIHDNGRLYLEFNKDNNHVNRRVFRLNEDIHGLYYVTDFGQLIIAAYSLIEIRELEKTLNKSEVGTFIVPTSKYEFKEPILYEFIQSDFDDFSDFLEFLNSFE